MTSKRTRRMVSSVVALALAIAFTGGALPAGAAAKALKDIVPAGAKVERVSTGHQFTEGPAWDYKGNLYWSDIPRGQILKLDSKGKVTVYRDNSGRANGLMFDKKGRLVACEGGARRVSRTKPDGAIETVAARYNGKKLNSPNDLAIGPDGSIYFTDPRYGRRRDDIEQDKECVYRIAPDGKVTRVIDDTVKCNGIGISPDAKTLYIADNGGKNVRAYPLEADGAVGKGKVIAEMTGGPDGMTVDADGYLYVTGPGGIWVFTPAGKKVGVIATPEHPANCAFGGAEVKTLFITARKGLYKIKLNARGWLVHIDGVKGDAAKKAKTKTRKIVLIAGRPSHGGTAHTWHADAKLLKHCLDTSPNVKGVKTEVHFNGWPKDATALDDADTIVLLSDGFGGHPFFRPKERADHIERLMRRGVGLACIHYAVAPDPNVEDKLLKWIGGIYKKGYSKNPMNTVEVSPGEPDHPICRGWKAFTAKDEFYYRIWFGQGEKGPNRAVPIMTAMLPKNQPKREAIAWAVERKDGGRGFGFTGAHYHNNWHIEGFRKMVLNAVVWTAKIDVPAGGVKSTLPKPCLIKARGK